jgi:hypothetical protein
VLLLWASTTELSTEIIVVLEESGRGKAKPSVWKPQKDATWVDKKKVCTPGKKKEFRLCVDSATDVARLGALCFCIQRFVAVFAVPPRCTALTSIALHLHWTGHRHFTINENAKL